MASSMFFGNVGQRQEMIAYCLSKLRQVWGAGFSFEPEQVHVLQHMTKSNADSSGKPLIDAIAPIRPAQLKQLITGQTGRRFTAHMRPLAVA